MAPSLDELTIGVEIEFVLVAVYETKDGNPVSLSTGILARNAHPVDVRLEIKAALEAAGLGTAVTYVEDEDGIREAYNTWFIHDDPSVDVTRDEAALFRSVLTKAGWNDRFGVFGLELSSPVYKLSQRDQWSTEISLVLDTIQGHFNRPDSHFRAFVNATTGFHVHVGVDTSKSWSKHVVKNIEGITMIFERLLDQMHSATRISPFHTWNRPNSIRSHKIVREKPPVPNDPFSWWEADIEPVKRWKDFLNPLDSWLRSYAVNYHNICKLHGNVDMDTIEFRQHRGTLDFVEIAAWIDYIGALVHYARKNKTSKVKEFLARSRNPRLTLKDVFEELECPSTVFSWYLPRLAPSFEVNIPEFLPMTSPFRVLARAVDIERAIEGYRSAVAVVIWKKHHAAYPNIVKDDHMVPVCGDFDKAFLEMFADANWPDLNLDAYRTTDAWGPTESRVNNSLMELSCIYGTFKMELEEELGWQAELHAQFEQQQPQVLPPVLPPFLPAVPPPFPLPVPPPVQSLAESQGRPRVSRRVSRKL